MGEARSEREVSKMEFLYTARKLQIFTIQKCVNTIPKRYTFFIATHLTDSATAIYANVKRANSVYPLSRYEAQIRRNYFMKACVELQNMVSQVELAHEIIRFDEKILHQWSGLINWEIKLVSQIMKKDQERYKNLP